MSVEGKGARPDGPRGQPSGPCAGCGRGPAPPLYHVDGVPVCVCPGCRARLAAGRLDRGRIERAALPAAVHDHVLWLLTGRDPPDVDLDVDLRLRIFDEVYLVVEFAVDLLRRGETPESLLSLLRAMGVRDPDIFVEIAQGRLAR